MSGLKIPNLVWISLLVAVSAFVALNWPDQPWANLVTIAIAAIVKVLEVSITPADVNRLMTPGKPPSRLRRFLVG